MIVNLGTLDRTEKKLRAAAEELAVELVAEAYAGDAPAGYFDYIQGLVYEQMFEGVQGTEVDSLDEWRADQDLSERADRDVARASW